MNNSTVHVRQINRELGFGEFGVADVPYDSGYRKQFLMGNRQHESRRGGQGIRKAYEHFKGILEVPVTDLEGNPHKRPDDIGLMFEFKWNDQSIDGNLRILYTGATGVMVNLHSDTPLPQDLTDRVWNGFKEYSDNRE